MLTPFYALLVLLSLQTVAAAQDVTPLNGPRPPEQMQGEIDYYLDPGRTLGIAEITGRADVEFQPVTTAYPDFGYTQARIWLRVRVQNRVPDVTLWKIHFRENFKQEFAVYIQWADGKVDEVFSTGLSDGFDARPIAYPEMVAPLILAPGETATVYIGYWSEGASSLSFGFETEQSFAARAATRTAKNFLYYGMMLFLVLISLIALVVFRHPVFAAYSCNCIAWLMYLMHADGVTFQYLWPNSPGFNSFASIPLGAAIVILAPNFTRVFLDTRKNHPILDKLLLGVIVATALLLASAVFVDWQILKKVLILCALVSVSLCTLSGIVAAFARLKEVRFFVIAWVGFLGSALLMSMRHLIGLEVSQDFQHDFMRVTVVIDATLMGLSIADRFNQLRQSRQKAVQDKFEQENLSLTLLARLSDLEKRHAQAIGHIRDGNTAGADTLHDLQQPLQALRLSIAQLAETAKDRPKNLNDVENAFAYIEELMTSAVGRLHADAPAGLDPPEEMTEPDTPFGLRQITDSAYQMFLGDARQKGLDFRYVPPREDCPVPPLAAMRVISNLVSNAIKYTDEGAVLLCARKRGNSVRIEVHDTGPGMTAQEFDAAIKRSVRLHGTDQSKPGLGLGLAIVHQLATQNGFQVHRLCNRQSGLSIGVTFPLG